MTSLLRLEHCIPMALEVHAKPNPCAEPMGNAEPALNFSYNLLKHAEEMRFFVQVNLIMEWEEQSDSYYQRIATAMHGYFALPEDTPVEEVAKYVPSLCVANLIGIARGQIAQVTGTFPGGAYYLPLLNVNELISNNPPPEQPEQQ